MLGDVSATKSGPVRCNAHLGPYWRALAQAHPPFQGMSGSKIFRRQTPPAFLLQLVNPQGPRFSSNDDAGFVGLQDFAGRAGLLHYLCSPDLQQERLRLRRNKGEGTRPGNQAAYLIAD